MRKTDPQFLKNIIMPDITDMQCESRFTVNQLLFMTLFCGLLEKKWFAATYSAIT